MRFVTCLGIWHSKVPVLQSTDGNMVDTADRVFFLFAANSQYIYRVCT